MKKYIESSSNLVFLRKTVRFANVSRSLSCLFLKWIFGLKGSWHLASQTEMKLTVGFTAQIKLAQDRNQDDTGKSKGIWSGATDTHFS